MTIISAHHPTSSQEPLDAPCQCISITSGGISKAATSEEPREVRDCNSLNLALRSTTSSEVSPRTLATASELVAIHVIPAPTLLHKAAALMQAHRRASQSVAGDKFNLGRGHASALKLLDLQSQPFDSAVKAQ